MSFVTDSCLTTTVFSESLGGLLSVEEFFCSKTTASLARLLIDSLVF